MKAKPFLATLLLISALVTSIAPAFATDRLVKTLKAAGLKVTAHCAQYTSLEDPSRGLMATCMPAGLAFITDSKAQKLYLLYADGRLEVMDANTGSYGELKSADSGSLLSAAR